jgi:hypothetical protein
MLATAVLLDAVAGAASLGARLGPGARDSIGPLLQALMPPFRTPARAPA